MSFHPELGLISAVIRTGDITPAIAAGVTSKIITDYTDEWEWIELHFSRRGQVPSKPAFKSKFPDTTLKAVDDVGHYADEVRSHFATSSTFTVMERALDGLNRGSDPMKVVAELQRQLIGITALSDIKADHDVFGDWQGLVADVESRVKRAKTTGMAGVPTGWPTLDEHLGGYFPGCIYVFGARPGIGKSWSLIKSSAAAVMAGYTVQYNALEQASAQIAWRVQHLLSKQLGPGVIEAHDLMTGRIKDVGQYRDYVAGLSTAIPGRLLVNDTSRGRVSPLTIAAQIERNSPDLVMVDYLQLMDTSKDWQALAAVVGEIKLLSEQYQVPIVMASQLNRAQGITREPPGSEAFSGSDAIGQDADALVTMSRWSPSTIKMRLAKHRHGKDGMRWWSAFDLQSGRFEEIDANEAQRLIDEDKNRSDDEDAS